MEIKKTVYYKMIVEFVRFLNWKSFVRRYVYSAMRNDGVRIVIFSRQKYDTSLMVRFAHRFLILLPFSRKKNHIRPRTDVITLLGCWLRSRNGNKARNNNNEIRIRILLRTIKLKNIITIPMLSTTHTLITILTNDNGR